MSRNARINTLLLLAVAALAVLPLALGLGDHKEEPFTGADGEAEAAITELEPDYEPWFTPLYEPPSGEIESALFSLQAALGAGVLAYYFGLRRGRRQGEERAAAAFAEKAAAPAGASSDAADADAGPAGTSAAADTGSDPAGTSTAADTGSDPEGAAYPSSGTGADAGTRAP